MIKWEYKIIEHYLDQDDFWRLGHKGWELVTIREGGDLGIIYFFKRPVNFMELQNELREAWVEAIKATFAELFND